MLNPTCLTCMNRGICYVFHSISECQMVAKEEGVIRKKYKLTFDNEAEIWETIAKGCIRYEPIEKVEASSHLQV